MLRRSGTFGILSPTSLVGRALLIAGSLLTVPPSSSAQVADPVAPLRQALQSKDANLRKSGLSLMSELAQSARSQYGAIDEKRAEAIFRALRDAGSDIRDLVKDADPAVRAAAIAALGHTRAPGTIAGPAWLAVVKDGEARLRLGVVQAIRYHVTRTVEEIRNPIPRAAAEKVTLLVQLVVDGVDFLPVLDHLLRSTDAELRTAAMQALVHLLSALRDQVKELTPGEMAANPILHASLRHVLEPGAKGLRGLIPTLVQMLRDSEPANPSAAGRALEALARMRDPRPTPLNKGADSQVRAPRGRLLQPDFGEEGQEAARILSAGLVQAVPGMAAALPQTTNPAKLAVLETLESLGPVAEAGRSAVIAALQDADRFVRWSAARALGQMGPGEGDASVLALAGQLREGDLDVRSAVSQALARYGPRAAPAVPALARAVVQSDPDFQSNAIRALSAIGPAAREAIPFVALALKSSESRVKVLAANFLGTFGPEARAAVPALEAALRDADQEVRQAAGEALLKILTPN